MKIIRTKVNVFAVCALLFAGCLTAKKVDKQVAKQYADKPATQKKKQVDYISVTSDLLSADEKVSTTETKTSNMLPLLFYWSWDYKNTCTLNPRVPINNFTSTVLNMANRGLKEKLAGQKLELSVDEIPHKFAIDDKAHLIFVIYAFGWDNVAIKADNTNMVVSYKLLKENAEIKKGVITIPYTDSKKNIGMFKSWKTATTEYLDQYDASITSMSKMVVDKILKEL